MPPKHLDRGRRAYDRRAWKDAHALLSLADRQTALRAVDFERLGTAAFLIGREKEFERIPERAHHGAGHPGRVPRRRAVRPCAGRGVLRPASLRGGDGRLSSRPRRARPADVRAHRGDRVAGAPPPELQKILHAAHGNQEAMDGFARLNAGVIAPPGYVSGANVQRILAAAR